MTRLLFVVTEDWYFVSHRLDLAKAAKMRGYRVAVLCRVSACQDIIESAGIELMNWRLERGSVNPFLEFRSLIDVRNALRTFNPDLVHAVALKPSVYAAVMGKITGTGASVYALGGLGFIFSSSRPKARLFRTILLRVFRWMFSQKRTLLILQNPDDQTLLISERAIAPEKVRLIRGVGVDTDLFCPRPNPPGPPVVILPARLLWDKGVGEFVAVARALRSKGVVARFVLVGASDPHNPESIHEDNVQGWVAEGIVEAWGHRDDMPEVLRQSSIVCLPSYREGLPKALIEAASCARPIVAFDVAGCREVVEHGKNGLLVPFGDIDKLSTALATLISDPELRGRMGDAGRDKVLREFSKERITEETVQVWREAVK